jgi:hypothetical protein
MLVPTFVDRGCRRQRNGSPRPYSRLSRPWPLLFLSSIVPRLHSRGWVDSFPDPLLLRKSGGAANRTRTSGSVTRNTRPQSRYTSWWYGHTVLPNVDSCNSPTKHKNGNWEAVAQSVERLADLEVGVQFPVGSRIFTSPQHPDRPLRLRVNQAACRGVEPGPGPMTRCLLLFDSCSSVFWGTLSNERTCLSFASHNQLYLYLTCFYMIYLLSCVYNLYKTSFSPGAV